MDVKAHDATIYGDYSSPGDKLVIHGWNVLSSSDIYSYAEGIWAPTGYHAIIDTLNLYSPLHKNDISLKVGSWLKLERCNHFDVRSFVYDDAYVKDVEVFLNNDNQESFIRAVVSSPQDNLFTIEATMVDDPWNFFPQDVDPT